MRREQQLELLLPTPNFGSRQSQLAERRALALDAGIPSKTRIASAHCGDSSRDVLANNVMNMSIADRSGRLLVRDSKELICGFFERTSCRSGR